MLNYDDLWGTYAVLTYPWHTTPCRDRAIRHGILFLKLLNEGIFGKLSTALGEGLLSVFTVESKAGRHHLNYLLQNHPFVIPELIRYSWSKAIGYRLNKLDSKCVTTLPIDNPRRLIGYILKDATWENSPEVYIPKSLLKAKGEP